MQRRPGAELGRSWFWCILITAGQVNFAMSAERFGDRRRGGGGAGSATGLTRQVLVGCGLRERRRRPYCVVVIRRPIRRGRDERRSSPGGRRTRGNASRGAGRGRSADEDVDARSVGRLDADASPETGVRASRRLRICRVGGGRGLWRRCTSRFTASRNLSTLLVGSNRVRRLEI